MDDLVSRKAAIEIIRGILNTSVGFTCALEEMIARVEAVPSVPAVPLEPICQWLAGYAAPPMRSPLALHGSIEEAWKAFLIDWMEENRNA